MKRIVFEGRMASVYPDGIEVEGETAAECIALLGSFPGFRSSDPGEHMVVLPDFGSKDSLYAKTNREVIRLVEVVGGAGGKVGMFLIVVIGIVLIATGVGAPAGGYLIGGVAVSGSTLVAVGAMLVLNGVVALLTPAPETKEYEADGKSNYLNAGSSNTTRAGTRIALILGRRKVGGQVLSFNVTATNMSAPSAAPAHGDGGFSTVVDSNYESYFDNTR